MRVGFLHCVPICVHWVSCAAASLWRCLHAGALYTVHSPQCRDPKIQRANLDHFWPLLRQKFNTFRPHPKLKLKLKLKLELEFEFGLVS